MDRPALKKLLDDVRARRVDVIVVYKVDRLTRSLADFAKLVELFDEHQVSFVSVTQSFNTTTSMGRLTLNVLLSFFVLSMRKVDVGPVQAFAVPFPVAADEQKRGLRARSQRDRPRDRLLADDTRSRPMLRIRPSSNCSRARDARTAR